MNANFPSQLLLLCVDDDPTCLATLKFVLRSANLAAVYAANGNEALEAFRQVSERGAPPAMVISDFDMPEMNGAELADELRKKLYNGPILFFTGRDASEVKDLCARRGVVPIAVVYKPNISLLINTVKSCIKGASCD